MHKIVKNVPFLLFGSFFVNAAKPTHLLHCAVAGQLFVGFGAHVSGGVICKEITIFFWGGWKSQAYELLIFAEIVLISKDNVILLDFLVFCKWNFYHFYRFCFQFRISFFGHVPSVHLRLQLQFHRRLLSRRHWQLICWAIYSMREAARNGFLNYWNS